MQEAEITGRRWQRREDDTLSLFFLFLSLLFSCALPLLSSFFISCDFSLCSPSYTAASLSDCFVRELSDDHIFSCLFWFCSFLHISPLSWTLSWVLEKWLTRISIAVLLDVFMSLTNYDWTHSPWCNWLHVQYRGNTQSILCSPYPHSFVQGFCALFVFLHLILFVFRLSWSFFIKTEFAYFLRWMEREN